MGKSFDHARAVEEFFRAKQREDPEAVKECFEKYPTLNYKQIKKVNKTEQPCGLLGTPQSTVPRGAALEYGLPLDVDDEYE